jgi:hypothetical protein
MRYDFAERVVGRAVLVEDIMTERYQACTQDNTISLQDHIYKGSRAEQLAYRGNGNSDPSLSEAEGFGTRWLVGMRVDQFILISDHW